MPALRTEYAFTLPKGYVDDSGRLHRHGTMRLATARDELEPLRDPRITGPDDPYLTILVLARVLIELGSLPHVTPRDVEGLFAADLAFLQDLYGIINFGNPAEVAVLQASVVVDDDEPTPDELEPLVAAPEPAEPPRPGRRRDRIEEVSTGSAGAAPEP
jgi:hypothetical protein